jgi:hypothetical protein
VIHLQTAFGEQLFDIAERERVPKIPAHGTKNQLRRRLPPLEDLSNASIESAFSGSQKRYNSKGNEVNLRHASALALVGCKQS